MRFSGTMAVFMLGSLMSSRTLKLSRDGFKSSIKTKYKEDSFNVCQRVNDAFISRI